MAEVKRVSVDQAHALLNSGQALALDVRDGLSYQQSHIPGARPLNNEVLPEFLADTPQSQPLVIYCYHGHSSLNAAQFLLSKGYEEVYSMDGGFESWRHRFPTEDGA